MKKRHAFVLALVPVSLGALAIACADYTSDEAPDTSTTSGAVTTDGAVTTGGGSGEIPHLVWSCHRTS